MSSPHLSSGRIGSDGADAKPPDECTSLLKRDSEVATSTRTSVSQSKLLYGSQNSSKTTDEETAPVQPTPDAEPGLKSGKDFIGIISVLVLDGSIVLATYATISSEVDSLDNGSWIVLSYSLAMCAIQPTYGKLSDIYGRKATLIAAYTLFTFGSLLCGAGQNLWQVVLGRAIAGLGGAGMMSLVSILIADSVPKREIATWRSYVNVASTVGRSAGGPFGGLLADTIGWRWSFYIQCPLSLFAILLVTWKLKSPAPLASFESDKHGSQLGKLRRIDFLGATSLALTIVGFLLVLDLGGQKVSWTNPLVWIILAIAAICGIIFIFNEAYIAREPIFPLRLLVRREVMAPYLMQALQNGAQFSVMYTVPLYFQITARTSVATAGAHLFPAVFGNAVAGLLSGYIIKRTASYKYLTIAGTTIATLGYLLLILFWRGNTSFWESLYITPGGFGMGTVFAATFVGLAAGVEESQMAIASTGLYLSTNLGTLTGMSVASKIMQASLRKGLKRSLVGFDGREVILEKAISDLEFVKGLEGELREVVVKCYVKSFEYTHGGSNLVSARLKPALSDLTDQYTDPAISAVNCVLNFSYTGGDYMEGTQALISYSLVVEGR
ncbi:hypothetical protein G7Y79_00057g090710 [Physcia stellaris]|nr:hypothetical protein G7Y79_00057g090710 [Physcia stellaris]